MFWIESNGFAAYQTWTNDIWMLDNNGNPIMAQSGGISKFGGSYYWYGVQYAEMGPYFTNGTVNTSSSTFVAINCYSSTDLVHWAFQNQVVNKSTSGFSNPGWVGRMGQVVYNSADNQYVLWIEGLGGQACCTCSTPTGNFVLNHVQATITNVYYGPGAGDCTIFCDVDHGGTPYFICSDPHGRQHAYVCPLSSNYLIIGDAVIIDDTGGIPAWPQGQEANNMFERNGIYYYTMSNLAGWSYSSAYEVNSPNVFSPTSYTADAAYLGTTADYTHYSQVSFGFQVAGTGETNYIMVGDRWAQFIGTYASAGHGKGFSIMCPITFTNGTPYFQSENMFQVDAVTGKIRPATPADIPTNLIATASQGQTPGYVMLNWAATDGATAYNVYRSTTNGGPYTPVASAATNSYTDTGLQNGASYYYVVTSTNVFGESAYSAQVGAVPSIGPLVTAASAAPNPAYPNGTVTISATVTAQANPIAAVTVDVSPLGGPANQALISNGAGGYTNTITVAPGTLVGVQPLIINAVDNLGNGATPYYFSIVVGSLEISWNGGGADENWSDSTNWVGGKAPGPGYSLDFAGQTGLAPLMDASYNIFSITFDNTAGAFTIGTAGGDTLMLTGGVTNNSAYPQTLNVPVILGAPVTLNAATAGVLLGQPIATGSNLLTIANSGFNITLSGAISGNGGLACIGSGTNTLFGANTFAGNIAISNGTLAIGGTGQLGNGAYPGAIADNGSLTFNSTAAQTLSGSISGNGALNQGGFGSLTLAGANTFAGPSIVTSGTLSISNALALQNSTLNYSGGNVVFSGITAAVMGGLSGSQNLSLLNDSSAAVTLTVGGNNANTIFSGSISGSGASLTKAGTGTLTLNGNNSYTGATTVSSGVLQLNSGGVINGGAANVMDGAEMIVNGGSLTAGSASNIGAGATVALLLSGGSATFNGGLTADLNSAQPDLIEVTAGYLTASSLALGRSGFIATSQPAAGSTSDGLYVNGGAVNITGNLDMSSSSSANSSASARIDSGSLTVGGTVTLGLNNGGRWSVLDINGGAVTVANPGTGISIGGPNAGNAELLIRHGTASIGMIGLGYGTVADVAVLDITNGSLYVGAGGIVRVSPNVTFTNFLAGGILGATTNWSSSLPMILAGTTIQAADASGNPQNISLNGVLSGANLAKSGSGVLTLMGANTYTGGTTINGGTLLVNNVGASGTGSGAVVVNSGGTLAGTGILSGAVTVNSGGMIAPGNPLGTLTISNSLTLAGGSTTLMQVQHSPLTNDAVKVTGTLTQAGTLNVTNSNATVFSAGDTFKLFNAANYSGAFTNFILPALPVGLEWNTSVLNTSGMLSVMALSSPTIGNVSFFGVNLVVSGSGGNTNFTFYILDATNLVSPVWMPVSTNQFDGSGNFIVTNPINPTSQQMFYRLQLQ